MNDMYKRCIYCGEQLYRDESRCRYCLKFQNHYADDYDQPPTYDSRYESLIDNDEDEPLHYPPTDPELNYPAAESYSPRPRQSMSGVLIGGIVVTVALVGLILYVLLCR